MSTLERPPGLPTPIDISVIIPVLNEEAHLEATLTAVGKLAGVEVIVVDGGSLDGTMDIARSHGAQVLQWERGRAVQMNAGAMVAQGTVLLFIHGDVCLPEGWIGHVRKTLDEPGVVAGAFRFATDYDSWSMRFLSWATNLRSQRRQMPYGDQGLFLNAATFNKVDGFPALALMEDYEMVRRLQRHGKIGLAPVAALCSGRRWREMGPWRCMLRNQMCMTAYRLGVSADRIVGWYYGVVE